MGATPTYPEKSAKAHVLCRVEQLVIEVTRLYLNVGLVVVKTIDDVAGSILDVTTDEARTGTGNCTGN